MENKNRTVFELKTFARELRKNQTRVEKDLWFFLRNKKFHGYKFYRQQPIGQYIVDFICKSKNLIIELDGGIHDAQVVYDNKRTELLTQAGFKVIRFWNEEFINNPDDVFKRILLELEK